MFVALSILLLLGPVKGAVLATSKITTCYDSGTVSEGSRPPCRPLLTMAFTVETNTGDSDRVILQDAVDEAGTQFPLTTPVEISFAKLPSMASYPLTYLQDVNTQPFETQMMTTNFNCEADVQKYCPKTGFCCSCSMCSMLGWKGCETRLRGTLNCGFGELAALVSCVRFNATGWHAVFDIGQPLLSNHVEVTIKVGNVTNRVLVGTTFPKSLVNGITVEYHGDLGLVIAPPSFSAAYLVSDGVQSQAIIDRTKFTLEGSLCDKIGVAPETFVNQAQRCERAAGACLKNQIPDLEREARERRKLNQRSQYFLEDYGKYLGRRNSDNSLVYELPPQIRPSLLTVIADASSLVRIVNVIVVEALALYVVADALFIDSGRLEIFASLRNAGGISGTVTLSCPTPPPSLTGEPYVSLAAVAVTFQPREVRNVTLVGIQHSGKASRSCNFTAVDARGKVVLSSLLEWTLRDRGILQPQINNDDRLTMGGRNTLQVLKPPPSGQDGTCTDCPWYNPLCFLARRCFWQSILNVVVIILVVFLVVGFLRKYLASFCCPSEEIDDQDGPHHQRHRRRRRRSSSECSSERSSISESEA